MKRLIIIFAILIMAVEGFADTHYVKIDPVNGSTKICYSNGDGTFDGACADNSNKTFTDLNTALTAGDVAELSGGASGATYNLGMAPTKAVTYRASTQTGHNGLITISPPSSVHGIDIGLSSGTITFIGPMVLTGSYDTTKYPLRIGGTSTAVFNDFKIQNIRAVDRSAIYLSTNGVATFNRFYAKDTWNANSTGISNLLQYQGAGTITFNYSKIDYGAGYILMANGSTLNLYNNIIMGSPGLGYAISANVNATSTITSKNNAYLGCYPVYESSGGLAVITSTNDYWHQSGVDGASDITTFNSRGASNTNATIGSVASYINPKFTNILNSSIGALIVFIDDYLTYPYTIATESATAAGIKISTAYPISGGFTATLINNARYLINNGHEIVSHGKTHSSLGSLNGLGVTWSGGVCSITISGTRSGDSSTWTGTMRLTADGTNCDKDLSNASYDTLGEIIALAAGERTCNGRTVTFANSYAYHASSLKSLTLADVTLSGNGTLLIDETAFHQFEFTEALTDLESYINGNTGTALRPCDRNGANCITSDADTTTYPVPTPAYICKGYRTASGEGSANLLTKMVATPTLEFAAMGGTSTTKMVDIYKMADATDSTFNIYTFSYDTLAPLVSTSKVVSNRLYAMAEAAATRPAIYGALWHDVPYYKATTIKNQATAGNTSIDVVDSSVLTIGKTVQFEMDNNANHRSTVAGITDGDTITINDAVPVSRTLNVGTTVGTTQALCNLLNSFGVGNKTMEDVADTIRTSSDWTNSGNGVYIFSGTITDYLYNGDFGLQSSSPLKNAGAIVTGVHDVAGVTDYAGSSVYMRNGIDIGAYEYMENQTLGTGASVAVGSGPAITLN